MGEFLVKIMEICFSENKEKRNRGIFQFKSFVFLILILVLISDNFIDMKGEISSLIGEKIQTWILNISNIAVHIFTSLVIVSFIVIIISETIYKIMDKKLTRIDYFRRLRIGAFFRFSNSLEDVLIFLITGSVFDCNFVTNYIRVYSRYLWIGIFIACGLQFVFSSSVGILNRFFVLWSSMDEKNVE